MNIRIAVVMLTMPAAAFAQSGGTVSGVVTTTAASPRAVRVTIDQRVCGDQLADEAVVVNGSGALANAVVTLVGVKARTPHPAAAGIMNEKCRFSPHVQVVRPGATMTTSSSDPMLHTTNAQLGSRTLFNVAVPVPGVRISKPVSGPGVVRLSCNTHPWMRGWIIVTEDMAAVSGGDGRFVLSDVPPGTYELRIWHESLQAPAQKVTVAPGGTASVAFEMK